MVAISSSRLSIRGSIRPQASSSVALLAMPISEYFIFLISDTRASYSDGVWLALDAHLTLDDYFNVLLMSRSPVHLWD